MFLKPRTIRNEERLGSIDVALRRTDIFDGPTEYLMVYIKDGDAIVASADADHHTTFVDRYVVGHAIDCAIEFDGYWIEAENNKYSLVTVGDPYIFTVNSSGVLLLQIGKDGLPLVLCSNGVTKVSAIRGWKSTQDTDIDQGLICAYVKTDGTAYYRTYSRQLDGSCIWEDEEQLVGLASSVQGIKLFRTNDYRTGFLIESNGQISWLLTKRAWAGLSVGNEYLRSNILSVEIDLIEVQYIDVNMDDEYLSSSFGIEVSLLYSGATYSVEGASNTSDRTVKITTSEIMSSIDTIDFSLIDEDGIKFTVSSIVQDPLDKKILNITVSSSLNYANQTRLGNGTLSLSFYAVGSTRGEMGQTLNSFAMAFHPTGLVFTPMQKPEPGSIYNVSV